MSVYLVLSLVSLISVYYC